jgi:hypothetical protein
MFLTSSFPWIESDTFYASFDAGAKFCAHKIIKFIEIQIKELDSHNMLYWTHAYSPSRLPTYHEFPSLKFQVLFKYANKFSELHGFTVDSTNIKMVHSGWITGIKC